MNRFALVVLVASALGLVAGGPASAQDAREITVEAHDEGTDYWFEIEGQEGRNPTMTLQPGEQVRIRLVNEGQQFHNLHLGGPIDEATDLIGPGNETWLNVTVPVDVEESEYEYWCDPHRAQGMVGPLRLGTPTGPADGNVTDEPEGEPTDGAPADAEPTDGAPADGEPMEAGEETPAPAFLLALVAALGAALAHRR